MSARAAIDPSEPRVPSRYRAHLLTDPKATERGVLYRKGTHRYLLAWSRVKRALASRIGDGNEEEAATIVFDLVVEAEGAECVVFRMGVAPGPEAINLARAISRCVTLGNEGVRSLAADGLCTVQHPDIDTFEAVALEAVRFAAGSQS